MTSHYESLGAEIGRLVESKQLAYGDSFGKAGAVLRILYPEGVKPEQYDDLLAIVRDLDKTFRIATKKDAFGEDPWRDKAGYALLAAARNERSEQPDATKTPQPKRVLVRRADPELFRFVRNGFEYAVEYVTDDAYVLKGDGGWSHVPKEQCEVVEGKPIETYSITPREKVSKLDEKPCGECGFLMNLKESVEAGRCFICREGGVL